jgi:hypothetical protein
MIGYNFIRARQELIWTFGMALVTFLQFGATYSYTTLVVQLQSNSNDILPFPRYEFLVPNQQAVVNPTNPTPAPQPSLTPD